MENIEQILKLWERDAIIDQTEPSREIIKIPILHSKYLTILTKHKAASKKAHFDFLRMKKVKLEYYTGKMSKDELDKYGWEPFQFVLKTEIGTYMESDEDLIRLLEKKAIHDETITVVEAIMKELNSRTFQLKDFISWERFIGGQ